MGTCATGLVTRGFVCCDVSEAPISCDKPRYVGSIEVRPKIRYATTPPPTAPSPPTALTAQELRPTAVSGEGPAPVVGVRPAPVTSQELRPKLVKVEEEE